MSVAEPEPEHEHELDWFLHGYKEGSPSPVTHTLTYLHWLQGCVLQLKYNIHGVGGTLLAPQRGNGLPSAGFIQEFETLVRGFGALVLFFKWDGPQHYRFKIAERVPSPLDIDTVAVSVKEELTMLLVCWLHFEKRQKKEQQK